MLVLSDVVNPEIWLNKTIEGAQKLGDLSPSSIWAFIALTLIIMEVWRRRQEKESAETYFKIRSEEAKANIMLANAVDRRLEEIKDELREIRQKLDLDKGEGDVKSN